MKTVIFLARYFADNLIKRKVIGRALRLLVRLGLGAEQWRKLKQALPTSKEWLVVGNGPSLVRHDLEALSFLPSVASNKINLMYSDTSWRPDIYTIADPLLAFKLPRRHYETIPLTLCPDGVWPMVRARRKLAWAGANMEQVASAYEGIACVDPMRAVIFGTTVTSSNIMLAMWAGAETIYVVGCDHFYYGEQSVQHGARVGHSAVPNHFHPNYRTKGEIVNSAPVARMNEEYAFIRHFCEKHGVNIINISRNSHLDAFETKNIDEFLRERFASSQSEESR